MIMGAKLTLIIIKIMFVFEVKMFNFGIRKINKQGGSYLVSLPIQWLKDIGGDVKAVKIEMNTADKTLRIAPAVPAAKQKTAGFTNTPVMEVSA